MILYDIRMTKRLTVSVPDHVAERLEEESNASAFVTDCIEARMRNEVAARMMAAAGIIVTEEGLERARERMRRAIEKQTPERRRARAKALADARETHGLPRRPNRAER